MHDGQGRLERGGHLVGQAVGVVIDLFGLAGHVVLVLHAGHVDRVAVSDVLAEVAHDVELYVMAFDIVEDVLADCQLRRGDEEQTHAGVAAEQVGQRAHGAASFEVTDEGDGLSGKEVAGVVAIGDFYLRASVPSCLRACFRLREAAVEGVDVEQGLGGVLILAGAGVDDGDRPRHGVEQGGHVLGEAFHGVTHDDGVEVLAEGADGVVFGLALDLGGGGAVADGAIAHADDLAGGGEREERSR